LILANADTFGVKNLKAIHATAPAGFADLPAPDAIFIGGTGREVARLLEAAFAKLRSGGRLVVNVATLEMLNGRGAAGQHRPWDRAARHAALRGGQSDLLAVCREGLERFAKPQAAGRMSYD
jgi:precorrin-6B methylase 2